MSNASGAECKVLHAIYFFVTVDTNPCAMTQGVCTEAGMFALRERRIHVTQEDFEMAVAKVTKKDADQNMSIRKLWK